MYETMNAKCKDLVERHLGRAIVRPVSHDIINKS